MQQKLTQSRLIVAVISTAAEEAGIWAIWRWLLPDFGVQLHVGVLIGVMVGWGVFSICLFVFTTYTLKKQSPVGLPSMVGATGTVAEKLAPEGMVKIHGELWNAVSEEGNIAAGEAIVVTGEKGMTLFVRKVGGSATR